MAAGKRGGRKRGPGRPVGSKRARPGVRAYEAGELPPGEITFEVATDWLRDTHEKLGDVLGREPAMIPRMRMDPDATGYRKPPEDWETRLADRADARAADLAELRERLKAQMADREEPAD